MPDLPEDHFIDIIEPFDIFLIIILIILFAWHFIG